MTRWRCVTLNLAVLLWACGGDGPTDIAPPCTDDTGAVTVTVGAGLQPVFNWEPACAIAVLLVEEQASDQWGISTDDTTWGDPAQANLISPPVTYGVTPPGIDEFRPPETLIAGVTYELILWRVPPGSTTECMNVAFGACLMVVHEFTP